MPLIDVVTNNSLDFNLRSQFLNVILNSFENSVRHKTIHSNNYNHIDQPAKSIGDEFWEIKDEEVHKQVHQLYSLMLNKSQLMEDMYKNISFEIQKQRFFNSMLKHNLFFEFEFDSEEWIYKAFDHCLKMMYLCLAKYSTSSQNKQRNRTYEVTENYPQDYTSQRSVFDLHFWFRKVAAKGSENTQFDPTYDQSSSFVEETTASKYLTKTVIKKILKE